MNFFKKLFKKPLVSKRENEPDVFHISDEEELMNFAMEKARLTVDYFKSSLSDPKPEQQYFSLKARISDNANVEHIWLTDVSFDDNNNFFGKVGNEPLSLKNVRLGQEIGIAPGDVSDWMIIENGRLIGGYTIRVLRDKMSDKERESFDQGMGMFIDEGTDYFPHDLSTPEGAILSLEDAYDAGDIDRAIACKNFNEEARMMLAKMKNTKDIAHDEDMIRNVEELLKLSFMKHMQESGFPSFKNVTRAFPQRKYVNEDLVIVTEVCFNPDRTKSAQQLYVSKKDGEWKVLTLAND